MIEYNKLVRDKIPKIINNQGKIAITETLNNEKIIIELNNKLREELTEYLNSGDVEELADLYEVILGVLNAKNISVEEFEKIRVEKANTNGAFKNKVFLKEVYDGKEAEFLNGFINIVKNCKYNNTYKFAWAKSLVELASEGHHVDGKFFLSEIAEKYIGFYWNQLINGDFKQGQRQPKIVSEVRNLMNTYSDYQHLDKFNAIRDILRQDFTTEYEECLRSTVRTLKKDVSYRFLQLDGVTHSEVYIYTEGDDTLYMNPENVKILKNSKDSLIDLIDYKWGLALDKFAGIRKNSDVPDNLDKNLLEKFKSYFY